MELEQLRVFAAVADEGSFTGAARRLYISHSTVSRTITALEEELGVRLVERDNRFIALTKAGETLRCCPRQSRREGMSAASKPERFINTDKQVMKNAVFQTL